MIKGGHHEEKDSYLEMVSCTFAFVTPSSSFQCGGCEKS
jgi:hypothetical protein